jgi:hypothetical protein
MNSPAAYWIPCAVCSGSDRYTSVTAVFTGTARILRAQRFGAARMRAGIPRSRSDEQAGPLPGTFATVGTYAMDHGWPKPLALTAMLLLLRRPARGADGSANRIDGGSRTSADIASAIGIPLDHLAETGRLGSRQTELLKRGR